MSRHPQDMLSSGAPDDCHGVPRRRAPAGSALQAVITCLPDTARQARQGPASLAFAMRVEASAFGDMTRHGFAPSLRPGDVLLLFSRPSFQSVSTMSFAITVPVVPSLPIAGSDVRFPVRRIYCIGRNYAEHAREMGAEAPRTQPMFFMKPADAIVTDGADVPYPSATGELHHELEMVVALARGGRDIAPEHALDCVFGYGVGLDLTRRDLQAAAKAKGHPWDAAKGFDHSAPVSALRPASQVVHPDDLRLTLEVNGELRQQARTTEMIFPVAAIIAELSKLWKLAPGDLVFTGTPAGVGPLQRGDRVRAELAGVAVLEAKIA